ncbi:MAG: hypothetical protein ACLUUO_15880 [Sellimonas intestinalis]
MADLMFSRDNFCLIAFPPSGGWILQSWANAVPGSVRSRILSRCGANRIFFTASSARADLFDSVKKFGPVR